MNNILGGLGSTWGGSVPRYDNLAAAPICPCCRQAVGHVNGTDNAQALREAIEQWEKGQKQRQQEYRDDFGRVIKAWIREGE
jgi:hypothetical protein